MTYEETIELEQHIKLKEEAKEIYRNFLQNIKLEPCKYKGNGRFLHRGDCHNAEYFDMAEDHFIFVGDFLNNFYTVAITEANLFECLKEENRSKSGVEHLRVIVRG